MCWGIRNVSIELKNAGTNNEANYLHAAGR